MIFPFLYCCQYVRIPKFITATNIIKAGTIIGIIDAWLYTGTVIGWVTVST